ncbi:MAG TPA: VWA domain-containing protein [Vicinamibacterales bacterium]|nr:VWA domain-containing protein [Vicinamibacterales bacterium]
MRITLIRGWVVAALLAVAGDVPMRASIEQQKPAETPPQAAQQPPPPDQQPVFRTGINTVRVDVIVTDRQGNPVHDLKLEDFEIHEDGKPQKAETFRLIKIDTVTQPGYTQRTIRTRNDEETAAADENSRIFMFFLDDYHVLKDTSMSMKKPVIDFIANELAPGDLVGVMHPLTPIDAAVVTRNPQGVINAVERFEGRKYNYEPINEVERGYVYKLTPDAIEMIRRQVTFTALRGICTKLGSLREGRKSLILVSEGYNALLPPQMRSNLPGAVAGVGDLTRDPFAGDDNILEDRARMGMEIDLNREMQDVWDACNRNNTSIYSVDPRGLAVGGFDITANISMRTSQQFLNSSQNTLRSLAENTDGRAIVNRNDLGNAMKQIVRDASAYYLVGYTSSQAPTDGKFHEIRVRVKRPGLQVRHRKGYWAYTAEDVKRALAGPKAGPRAEVTKALAAIAPMTNRRYIRTWIGTEKGDGDRTRVTLLWEPLPATPGVKRDEPRRVTVLATSPSGDIVYRGRVPAEPAAAGTGGVIHFDAPAGKLDLRLTVEGDGTGTLDTESRELAVPDLTAPEIRLSTPKVWFARNAREFTALTSAAPPPPTATRDFRRTDRLWIRLEAYAPGTAVASVTAQLLNQQGIKMTDVSVTPPVDGRTHSIDLPLANLAAGQYLLEITATSDGQKPVSELVAFRVGS